MTPKLPGLLVRHIQEGRCIVFVGAGLSAGAGLPTWKRLLLDVVGEVASALPGGEREEEELRRLVEQNKLLEVADHCKERLGGGFHSLLTERLRGDTAPVPETFRLLMRMPFAAWVTTNYDKLLERAYSEERGGYPRVLTHMDTEPLGRLLFDGGQFVLKAHGDIDRSGTVVLTSRDYADIIHANPSFNAVFSSLLLTRALLFVGYSLSDPDFRLLMDRQFTAFKGFVPERYALMGGLGQVEQDVLWRTARIRVLPYPDDAHGEVLNFLRQLANAVAPGAKSASPAPPPAARPPMAPPAPQPAARPPMAPSEASAGSSASPGGPAPRRSPEPRTLGVPMETEQVSADASEEPFRAAHALLESLSSRDESNHVASHESVPRSLAGEALQLSLWREGWGTLRMRLSLDGGGVLAEGRVRRELTDLYEHLEGLSSYGERKARVRLYEELQRVLASYVPPEVQAVLAQLPRDGRGSLTLRLSRDLEWLPWELLPVDQEPLALRVSLVRAPVGISDAARGRPGFHKPARLLLIGDTLGGRLGGVRQEIEHIAALHAGSPLTSCTTLLEEDATLERVMDALAQEPDLIHFAGHCWYGADEAYLLLHGGVHLDASTLRSAISRRAPAFLVLNSHFTAFVPPAVQVSDTASPEASSLEPLPALPLGRPGFARVAAEVGVGAFVGCFGSPNDRAAEHLAVALHQGLLGGATVAEALHAARRQGLAARPDEPTPLQYILSGYGDLKLG
ncbi:SIR2 family protein [Myxococcaceae bacterium GXIMD 01537]